MAACSNSRTTDHLKTEGKEQGAESKVQSEEGQEQLSAVSSQLSARIGGRAKRERKTAGSWQYAAIHGRQTTGKKKSERKEFGAKRSRKGIGARRNGLEGLLGMASGIRAVLF